MIFYSMITADDLQTPQNNQLTSSTALSQEDENQLDICEGVPLAYQKLLLEGSIMRAPSAIRDQSVDHVDEVINGELTQVAMDLRMEIMEQKQEWETLTLLVYVNTDITEDGVPKEEYKYRIKTGIQDATMLGLSAEWVRKNVEGPMGMKF